MSIIRPFVITWLICWIVSVIAYVLSEALKAKRQGIPLPYKKTLSHAQLLLIAWPLALFIYFYALMKTFTPQK